MVDKTKYKKAIFTGGFINRATDGGESFCKEVVNGFTGSIEMLECIFGMPEDTWHSSMRKDKKLFSEMCPSININFVVATVKGFVDEIMKADVVYFRGGVTDKLYECLVSISGWEEALIGKTIIGASAGSYVLSSSYIHSSKPPELRKGFGIFPLKIVTHYQSTFLHKGNIEKSNLYWDQVDELMNNEEVQLTSIKLKEGEFKLI